jgi:tetratricopeptide (TPR) repeat protein
MPAGIDTPQAVASDSSAALVPGTRTEPQPNLRRWLLIALSAILVPVVVLALLEGVLRIAGVGFPTSLTTSCTVQGQPASCYNLFFVAPFFPQGMIKTPQVYAIPASKPRNTYRIVVLGESAAMGDPDPAYAFSRYLQVMLQDRYPQMRFEVINTGSVAINSYVMLPVAEGLAGKQPDLFIIYSGNNEVVGPYGPGTALTSSAMQLPVIRANIWLRSTRIGQLLTRVGTQKREWGGMQMFLDKQVPADSPLLRYAYENYAANLRDTIAVARHAGARVIVSTIVTNLKDCAPFASAHRVGLTALELEKFDALVKQGANLEATRSYPPALEAYSAAERIDDRYAELAFRLARVRWALGDYAAARDSFQRARDLDSLRFSADSKLNDINRGAASIPGVETVDADAVFAEQSPNNIVGGELLYDHVHPTPEGNYLLARTLFVQVASKLPGEQQTGAEGVLSQAECERRLALTGHDRARLAGEMLQRLDKPPFATQLNHGEQQLRLMFKAQTAETPSDTNDAYRWALQRNSEDHLLHYNYGLFLSEHDRDAAVEQFRMSRPWDGFPVFTPLGIVGD